MKQRLTADRRTNSIPVEHDRRKQSRRKEDLSNKRSYYIVLALSVMVFLSITFFSIIFNV
jgi:lipopolysaccharide/colanic/teichoic acid biosynthesis glycosyltransferase